MERRHAASTDTLVETVSLNNQTVEIGRYEIGDKIEFRFPWRDQDGRRHFKCCRTLDEARQAAQEFCSGIREVETPTAPTTAKLPKLTPELLAAAARLLGVQVGNLQTYDQNLSEVCDEFMAGVKGKFERREIRSDSYNWSCQPLHDIHFRYNRG